MKVITGKDEALDAWITANYLEKNFNKKSQEATKGILDLGGASTQILFVPQANYNGQNSKKIKLFGTEYNTYTQSFLCFGLNEANLMYRAALLKVSFLFWSIGVSGFQFRKLVFRIRFFDVVHFFSFKRILLKWEFLRLSKVKSDCFCN